MKDFVKNACIKADLRVYFEQRFFETCDVVATLTQKSEMLCNIWQQTNANGRKTFEKSKKNIREFGFDYLSTKFTVIQKKHVPFDVPPLTNNWIPAVVRADGDASANRGVSKLIPSIELELSAGCLSWTFWS